LHLVGYFNNNNNNNNNNNKIMMFRITQLSSPYRYSVICGLPEAVQCGGLDGE
jgi:hypothetical protein